MRETGSQRERETMLESNRKSRVRQEIRIQEEITVLESAVLSEIMNMYI